MQIMAKKNYMVNFSIGKPKLDGIIIILRRFLVRFCPARSPAPAHRKLIMNGLIAGLGGWGGWAECWNYNFHIIEILQSTIKTSMCFMLRYVDESMAANQP